MKIIHIITGLNIGGAEVMLYKLLSHLDQNKYDIEVISMMDKGVMGRKIEDLGIRVHTLEMKKGFPNLLSIIKTISLCKGKDIIQTWMYHADFLGFLVAFFTKPKKLFWGIRHSDLTFINNKRSTIYLAKINSLLSRWVDKIISISDAATTEHVKFGYYSRNFITIPNGFELDKFIHIKSAKNEILEEFLLPENTNIITMVARYHVIKDYDTLFKAVGILKRYYNNFVMLLCGENISWENKELKQMILQNNIENFVILLGIRDDIPRVLSASDIFVLSSKNESFSNVIAEAMACEIPCVVTDGGYPKYLVDSTGIIVKKENPNELFRGIEKLLLLSKNDRENIGKMARNRIVNKFDIKNIVNKFVDLYDID